MTNPGQTTHADQESNPGMMPEDPEQNRTNPGRVQDPDQIGYSTQGSSMGMDAASGQPGGMNAPQGEQESMDAPFGAARGTAAPPPPGGMNTSLGQPGSMNNTAADGSLDQGGYGGQQEYADSSDSSGVGAQGSMARGDTSQNGGMSQNGMDASSPELDNP